MVYFGEESEPLYHGAHVRYAESTDNIEFVHAPAECAAEHEAPAPGIALFRNFDSPKHIYNGEATKEALQEFVKPLTVPTLFEFTEEHVGAIFDEQRPVLIYFSEPAEATDLIK